MKKTLLVLFAVTLLTFGCADTSEDTIPDPVTPELNVDEQKSGTGESATRTRTRTRLRS